MNEEIATKESDEDTKENVSDPTWSFEPGHTAAEFKAKHMMISWVRGHFKNVEGSLTFDPDNPGDLGLNVKIKAADIWTGDSQRDEHLRSDGFLDVENHPNITFNSTSSEKVDADTYKVTGDLTIRGITQKVTLDVHYAGSWQTAYWTEDGDKGPIDRLGFEGTVRINRHDFKVSWNDKMDKGGVIVGDDVFITFDIEALRESTLKSIEEKKKK